MNPRERILAFGLIGAILLGGGYFLLKLFYLNPLEAKSRTIATLQQEIEKKEARIRQVKADQVKLAHWRQISLPPDKDQEQLSTTRRLYVEYLTQLMRQSGFSSTAFKITPEKPDSRNVALMTGKKPAFTRVSFRIEEGRGNLSSLVKLLEQFYSTGLLQQVRKLTVHKPTTRREGQQPDDLDISLTVEALVLNKGEERPFLMPFNRRLLSANLDLLQAAGRGPGGLAVALAAVSPGGPLGAGKLAVPARKYATLAGKYVFFSPPPPPPAEVDIAGYIRLTDISTNEDKFEANLFDFYNKRNIKLRPAAEFTVNNSKGEAVVQGQVVRIEQHDVYFTVDGRYYAMHVGQTLDKVLARRLDDSTIKSLKLTSVKPSAAP
jgi:hypothetical protein